MRIFAVILWFVLAAAAGIAMFHVTFKVEQLEAELKDLNRQIVKEQETIHVLKAEWHYLNRPQRLEALSAELLPSMTPLAATKITLIEDLPERLSKPHVEPPAIVPRGAPVLPASSRRPGR